MSIGILAFALPIGNIVAKRLFTIRLMEINFEAWSLINNTSKPSMLISYFLIAVIFFLYYLFLVRWMMNRSEKLLENKIVQSFITSIPLVFAYFLSLLFFNLSLFYLVQKGQYFLLLLGALVWIIILFVPIGSMIDEFICRPLKKTYKNYALILLCILSFIVVLIFLPYLKGGFPVANEFMSVPEETILKGVPVQNIPYIKKHYITGLEPYDPYTQWNQPLVFIKYGVHVENPTKLLLWIKSENLSGRQSIPRNQRYFYDARSSKLFVTYPLPGELRSLHYILSQSEEKSLNHQMLRNISKNHSREEFKFLEKNKMEFFDQSLAGHFFHHQAMIFGTISSYLIGKPRDQMSFIYGWGNTMLLIKLVQLTGRISFRHYTQIMYPFYILYFFSVLIVAAFIFQNIWFVLLSGALLLLTIVFTGFESIRIAPGFNPLRHFLDVYVLMFFFLYARTKKTGFLLISAGLSILMILADREFGVILGVAFLANLIINNLSKKNCLMEWAICIAYIPAAIGVYFIGNSHKQGTQIYTLLGLGIPPTPLKLLLTIFIGFGLFYFLVSIVKTEDENVNSLRFFIFYFQGLLVYYVWNPALNHFWSLGGPMTILLLLGLKVAFSIKPLGRYEKRLPLLLFACIGLILIPSLAKYFLDEHQYLKNFETHRVYTWNFPAAGFQSTMDPVPFADAVMKIKKYAPDHWIYLISKYDDILPWLSGKYSAMPYSQLALNLVTRHEVLNAARSITDGCPQYLFVDADIERILVGDIPDHNDKLAQLADNVAPATDRAVLLESQKKVFELVKNDYQPFEKGLLITVYKRISPCVDGNKTPLLFGSIR